MLPRTVQCSALRACALLPPPYAVLAAAAAAARGVEGRLSLSNQRSVVKRAALIAASLARTSMLKTPTA